MLDSSAKPSPDPLLAPQWLLCPSPTRSTNPLQQNNSSKSSSSTPTRWKDTPSSLLTTGAFRYRGPMTLTPKPGSSPTKTAHYFNDGDLDQLPRRRETKSFSEVKRGQEAIITHTPSGPRVESSGTGGMSHYHYRSLSSRSAALDSPPSDRRNAPRWAPDSLIPQGRRGGSFSSRLSDSVPDYYHIGNKQGLGQGQGLGLTNTVLKSSASCTTDFPSRISCVTRTPESSPELSTTPTFSKILNPDSSVNDVDSVEKNRIRYEQSRKLIPVMCMQMNNRKSLRGGNRTNSGNLLYYQGVVSPVKKQDPASVTITPHPYCLKKEQQQNQSKKQTSDRDRVRDITPEIDQQPTNRTAFYKSLKNESSMNSSGGGGSIKTSEKAGFSQFLQRSVSESCMMVSSVKGPSSRLPHKGTTKETGNCVKNYTDDVAPPSIEEELFLRRLGWNESSKATIITDEEIAEFKATLTKKNVRKNKELKKQDSRKQVCELSGLRSYQCSPIGHLSSYDIAVDDGTSDDANLSESGRSL
eukprot:g1726.t1